MDHHQNARAQAQRPRPCSIPHSAPVEWLQPAREVEAGGARVRAEGAQERQLAQALGRGRHPADAQEMTNRELMTHIAEPSVNAATCVRPPADGGLAPKGPVATDAYALGPETHRMQAVLARRPAFGV